MDLFRLNAMHTGFHHFVKETLRLGCIGIFFAVVACSDSGGGSSKEDPSAGGPPGESPSGGGSPGETPPTLPPLDSIPVEDQSETLALLGIENQQQLVDKIDQDGVLGLMGQIRTVKPEVASDDVVRMLHHNDKKIEYRKLEAADVSPEVITRLTAIRTTPQQVEQLVEFPILQYMQIGEVSDQAREVFRQQQQAALNRRLRHAGQQALSDSDFIQLQQAFGKVDMAANFGSLDRQFQNLKLIVSDRQALSAQSAASRVRTVNPVIESIKEAPALGRVLRDDLCATSAGFQRFPQPLSISGKNAQHQLIDNVNGDVQVRFNKPGVAVFNIAANSSLTLQNQAGATLVSAGSDKQQFVYLPVASSDVCKTFSLVGAHQVATITLNNFIGAQRMPEETSYVEDGNYITAERYLEVINESGAFQPQSLTFSTLGSDLTTLKVKLNSYVVAEQAPTLDLLLTSPSGTVYSALNETITDELQTVSDLDGVAQESGIWRLDVLPGGSISISNNALASVSGVEVQSAEGADPGNTALLQLTPYVSIGDTPATKEFVLGAMETLAFSHTGDVPGEVKNAGDIHAMLHTTLAPALEIPSMLGQVLDDQSGRLQGEIAAWQCWEKSGKTGHEYKADGECAQWRDGYLEIQRVFEDQAAIGTYEQDNSGNYPVAEPCPQWYIEEIGAAPGYMCQKGFDQPYDWVESDNGRPPEDRRVRYAMRDFSAKKRREFSNEDFIYALSNHYELYNNWLKRAIVTEAARFPANDVNAKILRVHQCPQEEFEAGRCGISTGVGFISTNFGAPAQLEPQRPVFAAPVEKMATSTDPITVDYAAWDADVYDQSAFLFAVLEYVATQALNVVNGNFMGMVCDSIGLADELHQIEQAAEDDSIGNARFSVNRFTVADSFYGLHNQDEFRFYTSGVQEQNTEVDTYGQKLAYAQAACGVANIFTSGSSFLSNTDYLLSLDYAAIATHDQITAAIVGASAIGNASDVADRADEIATLIQAGDFAAAKELMKIGDASALAGVDRYSDPQTLLETYQNRGSSANGNNVVKTYADLFTATDDDKRTQAGIHFERVASVPLSHVEVTLDRINVISNKEGSSTGGADKTAEVRLYPFVGEVNDAVPVGETAKVFNFNNDEQFFPANKVYINGVNDGDTIESDLLIYEKTAERSAAALYLELSIIEDDGNLEDDDMIGIFSRTIKLEEVLNRQNNQWQHLGGNNYQLTLTEVPVYNAENLGVLENPLSDEYASQQAHNRNRTPSALVTMTINVRLASDFPVASEVDTSLNPNGIHFTLKDPGAMNATKLDTYPAEGGELTQGYIQESFAHQVLTGDRFSYQFKSLAQRGFTKGDLYSVNPDSGAITHQASIDFDTLDGDLLPIKQAADTSYEVTSGTTLYSQTFVRLLGNNRLLVAFSHVDGAKIMIIEADDQGNWQLLKTENVIAADGMTTASISDIDISEDRSRLLVSFLPISWLLPPGGFKPAPQMRTNLYQLNNLAGDIEIERLGTLTDEQRTQLTARFIDNNNLLVYSGKFELLTSGSDNWNDNNEYRQTVWCQGNRKFCLYELWDPKVQSYGISDAGDVFELKDQWNVPYDVERWGLTLPRLYSVYGMSGLRHSYGLLKIGRDNSGALFKHWNNYMQLTKSNLVNGYIISGTETTYTVPGIANSMELNPVGGYFCRTGVDCSAYYNDLTHDYKLGDNAYSTNDYLGDFTFVDYERDLIVVTDKKIGNDKKLMTYRLYGDDIVPDEVSFNPVANAALNTPYESEEIVITGINRYTSVTIVDEQGLSAEYWRSSTNQWSSEAAHDIAAGERIKVRLTTTDSYDTEHKVYLAYGPAARAAFIVTTVEDPSPVDLIPDPISFTPVTGVPLYDSVISNQVMVSGITRPIDIAVTNGEYMIVGLGQWTSERSTVSNGQKIFVRHNAASVVATNNTTILTLNPDSLDHVAANFVSTTIDDENKLKQPPAFNFVSCSFAQDFCDFTFIDNEDWRNSITSVALHVNYQDNLILVAPQDYQLSAGQLRILFNAENNAPKDGGEFNLDVRAPGYYTNSAFNVMLDNGPLSIENIQVGEKGVGKIIPVSFDLTNRFNRPVSTGSVNASFSMVNNDSTLNEVYRYRENQSSVWQVIDGAKDFYPDSEGHVRFDLNVPGCVDQGDGLNLSVYSHTENFINHAGGCIDSEWTRREINYATYADDKSVAVDADGNVYYAINSAGNYGDLTNQGSSDIYVIKYDRNGEQQWVSQIASSGADLISYFGVYRSSIIVAGQTNGDIDGGGSGTSSGGSDLFVSRINHEGNVMWHKQWGTANFDSFLTAGSLGTHLYIAALMDAGGSDEGQEIHKISLEHGTHERIMESADTPADTISDIEAVADIHGNVRYYLSTNRHIYRINADDGNYDARSLHFSTGGSILLSYNQDVVYASMSAASETGGEDFGGDDNYKARIVALDENTLSARWSRIISTGGKTNPGVYPIESRNGVVYVAVGAIGLMYPDDALTFEPKASLNLLALHGEDGREIAHQSWYSTDHQQAALSLSDMEVSSSGVLHISGNVRDSFNGTGRLTGAYPFNYEAFILKAPMTVTAEDITLAGLNRLDIAETVRDFDNNLEWDDRSSTVLQQTSWSGAVAECDGLMLNSRLDWRLPSADELNRVDHIPAANTAFKFYEVLPDDLSGGLDNENSQQAYWTNLGSVENQEAELMWIHAPERHLIIALSTNWHKYRCVRDMN